MSHQPKRLGEACPECGELLVPRMNGRNLGWFIGCEGFPRCRFTQEIPENEMPTETTVVNVRKSHYDVYIGRGGQWGNPFIIGRDGTREEVIEKHAEWILTQPHLLRQLPMLRKKRLGCHCAPHRCHGDTLKKMADADIGELWAEIARLRHVGMERPTSDV